MIKTNSEKRIFTGLLVGALLLSIGFLPPVSVSAVVDQVVEDPDPCAVNNGTGEGVVRAPDISNNAAQAALSVPVNSIAANLTLSDIKSAQCATRKATTAVRNKTVGKTIFGVPVPFTSWDSLMKIAMKVVVKKLTDSTVSWINTGFDGNPMFVQSPGRFFADTANGLAENFINQPDSPLQFLCAPFADKIKLSLTNSYYKSTTYNPTCTFTGIQGNLEDFYKKFSAGGWDAWFSMTQNPNNNPYDSYLNAKVELDSQIASALHIKQEQLRWGSGFLSFDVCPEGMKVSDSADDQQYRDSGYAAGDCLAEKVTRTPGVVIEKQLQQVLGQGVTDIGLARSFDDVVSALIGALTKKIFSSASGLFSDGGKDYSASGEGEYSTPQQTFGNGSNPAQAVICSPNSTFALINTPVTWRALSPQAPGITMSYAWEGEGAGGSTESSVITNYASPGQKEMFLNVTATRAPVGDEEAPSVQTAKIQCGSVMVSRYQPLSVSCTTAVITAKKLQDVVWTATVTGGSGDFYMQPIKVPVVRSRCSVALGCTFEVEREKDMSVPIVWDGDEGTIPKTSIPYWPIVMEKQVITKSGGTTRATLTRHYEDDKHIPGRKSANVTVIDKDPFVLPVIEQRCDREIYVTY